MRVGANLILSLGDLSQEAYKTQFNIRNLHQVKTVFL